MVPCSFRLLDDGQSLVVQGFHILEPIILLHHYLSPLLTILTGYGIVIVLGWVVRVYFRVSALESAMRYNCQMSTVLGDCYH